MDSYGSMTLDYISQGVAFFCQALVIGFISLIMLAGALLIGEGVHSLMKLLNKKNRQKRQMDRTATWHYDELHTDWNGLEYPYHGREAFNRHEKKEKSNPEDTLKVS